jgi:hypothetical protein
MGKIVSFECTVLKDSDEKLLRMFDRHTASIRSLSDRYARIGLPCLSCGELSEQSLEWLRVHDRLYCFACGDAINLNLPETQAYIESLSKAAAHIPLFASLTVETLD